jgi:hypothetical protein
MVIEEKIVGSGQQEDQVIIYIYIQIQVGFRGP